MQPSNHLLGAGVAASADLDGDCPRARTIVNSDDVFNLVGGLATLPDQGAAEPQVIGLDVENGVDDVSPDSVCGVANLRIVELAHRQHLDTGEVV